MTVFRWTSTALLAGMLIALPARAQQQPTGASSLEYTTSFQTMARAQITEWLDNINAVIAETPDKTATEGESVNAWNEACLGFQSGPWQVLAREIGNQMYADLKRPASARKVSPVLKTWWSQQQVAVASFCGKPGVALAHIKWAMSSAYVAMRDALRTYPAKLKAYRQYMREVDEVCRWADRQMRQNEMTVEAMRDLYNELRQAHRKTIAVVRSCQRTKKRVQAFLAKEYNKRSYWHGLIEQAVRNLSQAAGKNGNLDPMYQGYLTRWEEKLKEYTEWYGDTVIAYKKRYEPILMETMFADLETFKGLKFQQLPQGVRLRRAALSKRIKNAQNAR